MAEEDVVACFRTNSDRSRKTFESARVNRKCAQPLLNPKRNRRGSTSAPAGFLQL